MRNGNLGAGLRFASDRYNPVSRRGRQEAGAGIAEGFHASCTYKKTSKLLQIVSNPTFTQMIRVPQCLPAHRFGQRLNRQDLMLVYVANNEISQLLGLVAHIHHLPVPADAFQALLSDVDDQRGAAHRVVAVRGYVDFHAGLRGAVLRVPVGTDQGVLDLFRYGVEDVFRPHPHDEVLGLFHDLFQQGLGFGHFEELIPISGHGA